VSVYAVRFKVFVWHYVKYRIYRSLGHFVHSTSRTQSLGSPLFRFTKQKHCTAQTVSYKDEIRVKTRKEADKYFEAEMKQSKNNSIIYIYIILHYYKSFFSPRQFKTMYSLNFIVSLKLENDSDGQGTHSGFDKDPLGITKENACGALCVKTNYANFLFQFCDALMVFYFRLHLYSCRN
jgi:hypothetical protein